MFAGRKERTAHGTQAAGDFGAEAATIKAMIDFFPALFLYVFTSRLTPVFCCGFV